jgi:hypothetical protein
MDAEGEGAVHGKDPAVAVAESIGHRFRQELGIALIVSDRKTGPIFWEWLKFSL